VRVGHEREVPSNERQRGGALGLRERLGFELDGPGKDVPGLGGHARILARDWRAALFNSDPTATGRRRVVSPG